VHGVAAARPVGLDGAGLDGDRAEVEAGARGGQRELIGEYDLRVRKQ